MRGRASGRDPIEKAKSDVHYSPMRSRQIALLFFLAATGVRAQQSAGASAIFNRYAPYATRIQVVERTSGAKSTIGSGFFTTAAGHVVTNYHVISSLINRPERYR